MRISDWSSDVCSSDLVQELRDDVSNDATPTTLPYGTFNFVGQQGPNGYWTANANAAVFLRDEGTESRRLSLAGGWHLPLPTSGGPQFDLSVGVDRKSTRLNSRH